MIILETYYLSEILLLRKQYDIHFSNKNREDYFVLIYLLRIITLNNNYKLIIGNMFSEYNYFMCWYLKTTFKMFIYYPSIEYLLVLPP